MFSKKYQKSIENISNEIGLNYCNKVWNEMVLHLQKTKEQNK